MTLLLSPMKHNATRSFLSLLVIALLPMAIYSSALNVARPNLCPKELRRVPLESSLATPHVKPTLPSQPVQQQAALLALTQPPVTAASLLLTQRVLTPAQMLPLL
jgi:hypothetical protein